MIEANARPERTNRTRTTNRKPDVNATTMMAVVKCNAASVRRMTTSRIDARSNAPNVPRMDASRPEAETPEIAINERCAAEHKLVEARCR